MVYKAKMPNSNFLFDEMPIDSIVYDRKGGCFISTKKIFLILFLIILAGILLSIIVFCTAKSKYERYIPPSLYEYINQEPTPTPSKETREVITKEYRIFIQPIFEDPINPYSYNGTVWISFISKIDKLKTLELDSHTFHIEDVVVYRPAEQFTTTIESGKRRQRRDDDEEEIAGGEVSATTEQSDSSTESDSESTIISITEGKVGDDSNMLTTTDISIEEKINETGIDDISTTTVQPNVNSINHNHNKTSEVVIRNTDVDREKQKLKIILKGSLKRGQVYVVKVKFHGKMTKHHGLVYTDYFEPENVKNHFAATVSDKDSTLALFPCFAKNTNPVPITISIQRPNNMNTVSNTDLESTEFLNDNWTIDNYKKTAPVLKHAFGFAITQMGPTITSINSNLSLYNYCRSQIAPALSQIESMSPNVLNSYKNITGYPYQQNKIFIIASPLNLENGDDVKPGFLIINENSLTNSHKLYGIFYELAKLWIQSIENHECTEKRTWIQESLPLYLTSEVLDESMSLDFIIDRRISTMTQDVEDGLMSLDEYDRKPICKFKQIVRNKGLYILHMMSNLIDGDNLNKCIKEYCKELKSNSTSVNLFDVIKEVGINKSDDRKNNLFENLIDTWSSQTRYPTVNVAVHSKSVFFEQLRLFCIFNLSLESFGYTVDQEAETMWAMPIHFLKIDTNNSTQSHTTWITGRTLTIDIDDLVDDGTLILVNPDGRGYYRVNYNEIHWINLISTYSNPITKLSVTARTILADDAFNLARYGHLNYSIPFNIISCSVNTEMDLMPWTVILENLEFIFDNTYDLKIFEYFRDFLHGVISKLYQKFLVPSEDLENGKLKKLLMKWACEKFGTTICVQNARKAFQSITENGLLQRSDRPADQMELLLCTIAKYGTIEEWKIIQNSFLRKTDHEHKRILFASLGCARDTDLVNIYVNYITKQLDYFEYFDEYFQAASKNRILKHRTLEVLYNNFDRIFNKTDPEKLLKFFNGFSSNFEFKMLKDIFSKYSTQFKEINVTCLKEIVHNIEEILKWKEKVSMNLNLVDFEKLLCT